MGLILELAPGDPERQRALKEALQKHMHWRSAGTVQYYDHALSTSEAHELLHEAIVVVLTAQPRDRAELQAALTGDAEDLLWFGDVVGYLGLSHGPRNNPGR